MTSPLVSIVLPTFNGSRYLSEAIQSCLEQIYKNWELIIVDDASTDETPGIISQYLAKDKRITSIRHKKNRKLPAALNTGFAKAKGEYLTWTSDDNCYLPDALEEMVKFLESTPGVDIVYADYTVIDADGNTIKRVEVGSPQDLYLFNTIGPCFLYRRAVLEKLGGYAEDLFLAEDYDFWLRASNFFRFKRIPRALYLYRDHTDSLTQQKRLEILLAAARTLERNFSQMRWVDRTMRAKSWINLMYYALQHCGDLKLARRYMFYAIRYSPRSLNLHALVVLIGHHIKRLIKLFDLR